MPDDQHSTKARIAWTIRCDMRSGVWELTDGLGAFVAVSTDLRDLAAAAEAHGLALDRWQESAREWHLIMIPIKRDTHAERL